MRLLSYLLLLLFCGSFTNLTAQRNCGSMDVLEQQLLNNPNQESIMRDIEEFTEAYVNDPSRAVNGTITIPVVVHVVYNTSAENISTSQVQSQINILTEDFRRLNSDANGTWPQAADTEIEFCLATIDPNGSATSGITRTSTSVTSFSSNDNVKFNSSGGKDAWPAADYLNFWVCDLSGGLLGYAQFPGGPANTDGVVCDYQYVGNEGTATAPFDLGRTATHEVGHWLNLRHIWGDGGCSVDDFVSDTPTSDASNGGCATGHVSCGSTDMVENYMDYSDDACMNLYTDGQKTRMRAIFDVGGFRESLLTSNGCGSGGPISGCTDPNAHNYNPNATQDDGSCETCSDGTQNGDETGVDCGGALCNACACNGTNVTLTIVLDNYPEETSWTLTNSSGATVASGGTYGSLPDGSTFTESWCLPDDCYDFTINDSYGDGICCSYGNGSYDVSDDSGNTLASGGSFGSSETTNFCVGGGGGPVLGCTDSGAHNYDPNATQDDGSCETCGDGTQNGDETGTDCGGALCAPCGGGGGCTDTDINFNNFDSSWGIWNDGGSDCRRSANDAAYAYSGNRCVRLRDNTSSSVMTTDNLNLSGYEEVTVDFTYLGVSMEYGEDFWLQVSLDGGASYQTLITWARGTDFSNNVREFETVVITGTFTSSTRFRFRCDASANGDRVYIDDVDLTGCVNGSSRTITEEQVAEKIETPEAFDIVNVYPNPANEFVTLAFNSQVETAADLYLVDLSGKRVMMQTITTVIGEQELRIDVNQYPTGIYFLHMVTEDHRVTKKLIIGR